MLKTKFCSLGRVGANCGETESTLRNRIKTSDELLVKLSLVKRSQCAISFATVALISFFLLLTAQQSAEGHAWKILPLGYIGRLWMKFTLRVTSNGWAINLVIAHYLLRWGPAEQILLKLWSNPTGETLNHYRRSQLNNNALKLDCIPVAIKKARAPGEGGGQSAMRLLCFWRCRCKIKRSVLLPWFKRMSQSCQ